MKTSTFSKIVLVTAVTGIVMIFAYYAAAVWVIGHFLKKFW